MIVAGKSKTYFFALGQIFLKFTKEGICVELGFETVSDVNDFFVRQFVNLEETRSHYTNKEETSSHYINMEETSSRYINIEETSSHV